MLGLSVPEDDGGAGGTLVDQAIAVEELGAALACGPLFGTVFLAIPALVAASPGPVRAELLARPGRGPADRGVRRCRPGRRVRPGGGHVCAASESGALTGDGGAGGRRRAPPTTCWSRPPVRTGSALYAVDAAGPGVERHPLVTLDLTRPQASVRFTDAPARLVAGRTRPGA